MAWPEFVHGGLVIAVRRGELFSFRQRHLVGLHVVKRAVAAFVDDADPALLDDTLGRLVGLPFGLLVAVVVAPVERQAVRLFDVEHGVAADHRGTRVFPLGLPLGGRAVGLFLLLLPLVVKLVKEHVGGLLARADLTAHVLDLFVGGPAVDRCTPSRFGPR